MQRFATHRRTTERPRERGAALVAVGLTMMAFLALAVVGVDLGRLALTATEVQAAADVAATAGVRTLLLNSITGAADNATTAAQLAVAQNRVDGQVASIAAGNVIIGSFDFTSGAFLAGGVPANAVRADANATVQNLLAGILGDPTTTVQKTATAAFAGISSGAPVLPLAVGDCHFAAYQGSGSCSDLPSLTQAPSASDNTCWTSLGPDPAGADQAGSYLPPTCCHGGNCGGGVAAPQVTTGSSINIMNGQADVLLKIIADCVADGITQFTVPVIGCNNCTGAMTVKGFATIEISSVDVTSNPKGINLTSICEADNPGAAGGGNFGTVSLSLVN